MTSPHQSSGRRGLLSLAPSSQVSLMQACRRSNGSSIGLDGQTLRSPRYAASKKSYSRDEGRLARQHGDELPGGTLHVRLNALLLEPTTTEGHELLRKCDRGSSL